MKRRRVMQAMHLADDALRLTTASLGKAIGAELRRRAFAPEISGDASEAA
jgi:hypothetical protein